MPLVSSTSLICKPRSCVSEALPSCTIASSYDGLEYAVLKGDWKLLLGRVAVPVYLFDVKADPYEITYLLLR